jgi:hypothetical protein
MYSFVHSKTRNRSRVEQAEELVYIYTNGCLLHQRLGTDPIHYHDDNIFLEDSDDDNRALSKTDDDDNDDNDDDNCNGGEGHDGNDGDSFDGGEEHCIADLPIIFRNVQHEGMYDWNEIDEEIANGVEEHVAIRPIKNMHIKEDAPLGFVERAYDRADEEPNDDDYMKLLMSIARRMETRMASMVIATTVVKVVLVALQPVETLMQPLLAVGMVDLVMFPRKNEPRTLQTRE